MKIFQFNCINGDNFFIKNNAKPNKEILETLGVNTSSVFLANTSVWVEGPTDRKYISKFLNLYSEYINKSPLKQDIDFAFFEYGGNLIEHYLFDNDKEIEFNDKEIRDKINAFALSNKIFLLADNDGVDSNSSKGKRRKALENISKKSDGFIYKNTILKEIENLLPKSIIMDFMFLLVKGEGIEVAKKIDFNRGDYKNIGLGDFYKQILKREGVSNKDLKSFCAPSGTLMNDYKIKLVNFVLNSNLEYSDFIFENNELREIVESLYNFIKK